MKRMQRFAKLIFLALPSNYPVHAAAAWFFVFSILGGFANAQSRDGNNPTNLTSKEVSGLIGGNNGNEHFYIFSVAGPSELKITLTFEAGSELPASALAFEFDGVSRKDGKIVTNSLAKKSLLAFRGQMPSQEVQSISVEKSMDVRLRISLYESVMSGKYKLNFDGYILSGGIGDILVIVELENANSNRAKLGSTSKQNLTSSSKLDGTKWKWQEKGSFFYVFPSDKPGVVISLAPYEFLNIWGDITTGVFTQVGSFTQKGNSLRLDFPDHYIIANINGDVIEGEITYKKSREGKENWKVQRTSKEK